MKFTILTTAFLAAVSTAAPLARRAVTFTDNAYVAAVGSPLSINWSGASGAATINLKSGEPGNLQTTGTIACKFVFISSFYICLLVSTSPSFLML